MELREQRLLEGRNAICMAFGRVSPMSKQKSFEELAVMFEGSGANGAERAYRRALDKLRLKLMESGMVHTVTLKQVKSTKKNKKIAAAASCIRQTTTANGVSCGLILRMAQRRS